MNSFNNKQAIFLSFFFAIRYPANHTILIYIRSHENNRYFPNFEKTDDPLCRAYVSDGHMRTKDI